MSDSEASVTLSEGKRKGWVDHSWGLCSLRELNTDDKDSLTLKWPKEEFPVSKNESLSVFLPLSFLDWGAAPGRHHLTQMKKWIPKDSHWGPGSFLPLVAGGLSIRCIFLFDIQI